MARLPWTKFQDFYLRPGFLKVLVATLDRHQRSVATEIVARRLERLLFESARQRRTLWQQLVDRYPWVLEAFGDATDGGRPTITEALLLMGDCPSQLYAITPKTAYKVLDWARDLQLIGAGNQITEKGLILRSMLPEAEMQAFLRGEPLGWNPFVLSARERLFFLFHLAEIDHLTLEVLEVLHRRSGASPIETGDAAEVTCRAFFRVLDRVGSRVSSVDLPALRRARELASVMARELQLDDVGVKATTVRDRIPRAKKVTSSGSPWAQTHGRRRTTKNSDHQTIPRFEQLVDLGFLSKPCGEVSDAQRRWECRRHWRYERLPSCDAWVAERQRTLDGEGPWEWRGFAGAALASGVAGIGSSPGELDSGTVAAFLWTGYQKVRRQIGHTPFHSIAMTGMIEAAVSGFAIEIRAFHDLLMALKKHGELQECVYFASGNEIDRMFVAIRAGFLDAVRKVPPEHLALPH